MPSIMWRPVQRPDTALLGQSYDLVILDLGLPKLPGIEVLAGFARAGKSATPVLILTAQDGVDDRVRGLDAGATTISPNLSPART